MAETVEHSEKAGLLAQKASLEESIKQRGELKQLSGPEKVTHTQAIAREQSRLAEIDKRLSEIEPAKK